MSTRSLGNLIADKYRLERRLATGGMGQVWAARNLQLDVPVAIKLMSADAVGSSDLVARFQREARAAAQLRHPNVVTVFEHGVSEGAPFIAMELLDGQDLSERMKKRGRLSYEECCPIVAGVCKALRRAHEMGIVHRDLKPANVFVAKQDDEEIVKVLDFGIAKILCGDGAGDTTKSGSLLGTPHYMAPEQARGNAGKVDHRADLWALGVIVFRMMTGKHPFLAETSVELLMKICTEPPPKCSSLVPELGAELDTFFDRALAREPEERFQSARELWEAYMLLGSRPPKGSAGPSPSSASGASQPALPRVVVNVGTSIGAVPEKRPSAPPPEAAPRAEEQPVDATTLPISRPVSGPGPERRTLRGTVLMPNRPAWVEPNPRAPRLPYSGPLPDTALASPPGMQKRNAAIIVTAVTAAFLVIAVVGWTVLSTRYVRSVAAPVAPSSSEGSAPEAGSSSEAPAEGAGEGR